MGAYDGHTDRTLIVMCARREFPVKRRLLIVAAFVGIMLVPAGCGIPTGGRGYSDSDDDGCFTHYSGSNRSGVQFCTTP